MPKHVAQSLGNMSQLAICLRISNVITLIDPSNLQMADLQWWVKFYDNFNSWCYSSQFLRDPFDALCGPKQLSEFYVLDVEIVENLERKVNIYRICYHFHWFIQAGHGFVSKKHVLADVWLVRSNQVGKSDAETLSARTHIGHLLNPGDLVLGLFILLK